MYNKITYMSCDKCGLYDEACNFPDLDTEEGNKLLEIFGWDLVKHKGYIQTMYAGGICKGCGNFSSFDFFEDTLEDMVEEAFRDL